MRPNDYQFLRDFVYQHSRINLGPDKQELVSARLGKRLRATNTATITDYCDLLRTPAGTEELGNLIDAISTNHTYFFREEGHFTALKEIILPDLVRRREKEKWYALRVWSAASSSGEEPYSVAMALEEYFSGKPNSWPRQIEATDISSRILAKAEAGIYPAETVSRISPAMVKTYFQTGYGEQTGLFRVKPSIRSLVRFRRLNLLEGQPPFTEPFQIIFCRNVMIYFDRPTQEELIKRLRARLVPGGYLMVGHSESLTGINHGLKMIRPATYQNPLD
ncbi:MAG: protein-glutamate O-methyltransferase [Verrucomicrobia bacterium]|nr:protein-glutamate O-methyltransferase [Verrucomicrobiota bacterium]